MGLRGVGEVNKRQRRIRLAPASTRVSPGRPQPLERGAPLRQFRFTPHHLQEADPRLDVPHPREQHEPVDSVLGVVPGPEQPLSLIQI